ncbi:hydrolase, TatD family [Bacteriovorax sp. Seq25_V]|nr:hydrolase, TatD family [Bacteriovorax sp. Seq25_V]
MVGESGIDRMRGPNLEFQEDSLREHIRISEELEKPLILHNVRGLDVILKLHREMRPKQAWILHDFNGNDIQIKQIKGKNIFASLGPTFMRDNSKIAQFATDLDIKTIFFETDDAKDLKICAVYEKYAGLLNMELQTLCDQIEKNFSNLFGSNV